MHLVCFISNCVLHCFHNINGIYTSIVKYPEALKSCFDVEHNVWNVVRLLIYTMWINQWDCFLHMGVVT